VRRKGRGHARPAPTMAIAPSRATEAPPGAKAVASSCPQDRGCPGSVSDLDGATRLFQEVLDGRLEAADDHAAELIWPGGIRIRLVREDGLPLGGALHHVRFSRAEGAFSAQDVERAAMLAKRLGMTVELTC
jgi:hypothetical protein